MNPDLLVTIAFCVLIIVVAGVAFVYTVRSEEPARAGADLPAAAAVGPAPSRAVGSEVERVRGDPVAHAGASDLRRPERSAA